MFYGGNNVHIDNSSCEIVCVQWVIIHVMCVIVRVSKIYYLAFFTVLNCAFCDLFWFCNFFHGMPGFKKNDELF